MFPLSLKAQSGSQGFSDVSVGVLGVYSFLENKSGIEARTNIDSSRLYLPLEWQFIMQESVRVRTWPQIFFKKRKSKKEPAAFLSLYSSSLVKTSSSDNSSSEFGIGAGFSGAGFSIAVWLTTSIYQGDSTVEDIFGFRARAKIDPGRFYGAIGFKIGPAVADNGTFKTSTTTFEFEIEAGYRVIKSLTIFGGIEARTDNLGALFDSDADLSNVSEAFQALGKFGINYHF